MSLKNNIPIEEKNEKIIQLKKELSNYKELTSLSGNLLVTLDNKLLYSFLSPSVKAILGFEEKEILGHKIIDFIHPDDRFVLKYFTNFSVSTPLKHFRFRHLNLKQEWVWFDVNMKIVLNKKIIAKYYLTLQPEPEQLINDFQENELSDIFKKQAVVIFRYNTDLQHEFVSKNVSELLPFEAEELMGCGFEDMGLDQEKISFFQSSLNEVFKSGKEIKKQFQLETQKGLMKFSWTLIPEKKDKTSVVSVFGLMCQEQNDKYFRHELNQSKQKFDNIFETIPDAVVISRYEDGLLYKVNKGFLKLTGYENEEILNKTTIQIKLYKDKSSRDMFVKTMDMGPIQNLPLLFLGKNGEELEVLISSAPIILNNEKFLISIFKDIRHIRKNEKRLEDSLSKLAISDTKFRTFFDLSPDGIIITDENGLIQEWSKSMETFTHIKKIDVVGKSPKVIQKLINEINIGKTKSDIYFEKTLNTLFDTNRKDQFKTTFNLSLLLPDKSRIDLENIMFTFNSSRGIQLGIISRDITQQKSNAQNALLYKRIFENSLDGIAILDLKGNFLEANTAHEKITGFSNMDIHGNSPALFLGEKLNDEISKVYNFQEIFDGELKAVSKSKHSIYLEYILFPVITNEIQVCSIQIVRDISHRKKGETELLNAKRKAEEADQLKTAFLSNMSHEIRTPMNSILGFSSLLEKHNLSNDQRHKYLSYIKKNGESLLNLIGDIIDISKIESNQISISKSTDNLTDLMNKLYISMHKLMEKENKENIILRKSFSNNENLFIYTDHYRLEQILINLLHNAIKFTNDGFIEFGFSQKNSKELLFYVKDTGIGIPKDRIEKIFERFQKLEHSKNKLYGGAGLGLAISSQLIQLLGGKIWAETDINKGSTFYFTLPFIKKDKTEKLNKPVVITNDISLTNKKILIVEDDIYSYELLCECISDTKIGHYHAKNGKEAVNLVADNKDIALILMDVRLPEMNGIEASRLILQTNPSMPIIAQSAYAMKEDKEQMLSVGCVDFIAKPINKNDLLALIKDHMNY